MAQSYTNPGGSGNRTSTIAVTFPAGFAAGNGSNLVNGTMANEVWWAGVTTGILTFDFGASRLITEAKWYQSDASTHGTWKWQGSPDNSSWTDIGTTFTLGGATTQTITTLSGNATAYRYYRLFQTAGSTSASPWLYEVEFSIDAGAATTDARLGGLAREALVSDVGVARLGGLVREALVSGTGVTARAGGKSGSRASLSVLFAGVVLGGAAHARSHTRTSISLSVSLAGHAAAGSSAKVERTSTMVLAGRIQARSRGSMVRSNPATMTAWGNSASRMRAALTVGPPPVLRQYAVTVGA